MYFIAHRLRTLLSRLSAARAALLDNLDAAVSTRLAASSYVAPDNAGITAIKAKTDNLPATPASQTHVQTGATVPSADSAANANDRDVIGNKTDAAVSTVGTDKSLVAYVKGVLNAVAAVAQKNTTVLYEALYPALSFTPSTDDVYTAYTQAIASTGQDIELYGIVATFVDTSTTGSVGTFAVDVATGAATSEVVKATVSGYGAAETDNPRTATAFVFTLPTPIAIPSGTRVACRAKVESASATNRFVKVTLLWRRAA